MHSVFGLCLRACLCVCVCLSVSLWISILVYACAQACMCVCVLSFVHLSFKKEKNNEDLLSFCVMFFKFTPSLCRYQVLAVASDSGGKDETQNIRSGKRVTVSIFLFPLSSVLYASNIMFISSVLK